MWKNMMHLTIIILAATLALPTIGCQPQVKEKERQKAVDVQVDAGGAKVKVEGKKPDEKGRGINVEVDRHPGHEHGDHNP